MNSLKRKVLVGLITFSTLANIVSVTHAQSMDSTSTKPQEKIELNVEDIMGKMPEIQNTSSIESIMSKEEAEAARVEKERVEAEKIKQAEEAKAKLSDKEIAVMVIDGKYGNGEQRKDALAKEGRSYENVQNEVEKLTPKPVVKVEPAKVSPSTPSTPSKPSSQSKPSTPSKSVTPVTQSAPTQATVAAKPQGKTMTMQATGYSTAQPSLSRYTANGTDLVANPRVIAVDPSVIPIGSTVTIEGYGTYTAADTGGDIKGTRIDMHFSSVEEALSFGRRSVQVTLH